MASEQQISPVATSEEEKVSDAWSVSGSLQRTSRQRFRNDILEGQGTPSHIFKVSQQADKKDVSSPLPMVQSPTLMEIGDCGNWEYTLRVLTQRLESQQQELESLCLPKLVVDCMECVKRIAQLMNCQLRKMLGRQLQNVNTKDRQFLLSGPFLRRKDTRQLCGTYFDLLQFYDQMPSEKLDSYLSMVEMKVAHIIELCTQQHNCNIRTMMRHFMADGKALRDTQSHLAFLKDASMRELTLSTIEQYGKDALAKYGLAELFPVVLAGVHTIRSGEALSDSKEDAAFDTVDEPSSLLFDHRSATRASSSSVKVTFVVQKKVPLCHVMGLLGSIPRLGNNNPAKAAHMTCTDGLRWERMVELPRGTEVAYTYVVLQQDMANKNMWVIVEGPMQPLTTKIDALSHMRLETQW